ncbi:MAG: hypothetical protein LC128_10295 [Chitinophagales bacterium]|nr:hypothetical protein [Chitinophagales bacterium]
MKKSLLKQLLILIAVPALLLSFTSLPDRTNFSGEWKLNTDKSDLGQMANFAVTSLKVNQADESITIARTAPSFQGDENTTTEAITFDGKTTETKLFGESSKKSSIKWSEDGKTFTITYTLNLDFNGQQMTVEGTEKWSLSDDGKTLTLETSSTSDFGDMSTTAVYDKK